MAKNKDNKVKYNVFLNNKPIIKNGKLSIKEYFKHKPVIKKNYFVKFAKNFKGSFNVNNTKQKKWLVLPFGLIIGFINGFWGGGGGMVCVPTLSGVFKLNQKSAQATAILVMLPLSISSFIIYLTRGNLELTNIWFIVSGFFVGGIIGAMLLKKINNVVLKIIFGIIIIVAGVRLLF